MDAPEGSITYTLCSYAGRRVVALATVLVAVLVSASPASAARLGRVDIIAAGYTGVVSQTQLINDTKAACEQAVGSQCNLSQLMDGVVPERQPYLVVYEMMPEAPAPGADRPQGKRVLFMEGFDLDIAGVGSAPRGDEGSPAYAEFLLDKISGGPSGLGERVLNPLLDLVDLEGYTLHFIDIVDPGFRVGRNAGYLERYLLDNSAGGSWIASQTTSELAFIGWSMGGLIGRLALARLDSRGLESNVDLYVSYDSPHQGAYLPLSLEVYVRHLARTLNSGWLSTRLVPAAGRRETRGARELYNAPSAKELLGLWAGTFDSHAWSVRGDAIESDPVNGSAHPWYHELRQQLADAGGYPSTSRLVAVSLGNPIGEIEPQVDVSGTLFKSEIHQGSVVVHKGYVRASGASEFVSLYTSSSAQNRYLDWPARFERYESAPGSSVSLLADLVDNLRDNSARISYYEGQDRVTFVPTVSAIDVATPDFLTPANSVEADSPFDAIYYPDAGNLLHSEMSLNIFNSLVVELQNASGSTPAPAPAAGPGNRGSGSHFSDDDAAALMALF